MPDSRCLIVVANGHGNKQQVAFFAHVGFNAKHIPAVQSPDIHASIGKGTLLIFYYNHMEITMSFKRTRTSLARSGLIYIISSLIAAILSLSAAVAQTSDDRVFELRTYTTHDGRLDALHQRFIKHTVKLLEKHGMKNIGYWVPTDPEKSKNTLIYIVSHKNVNAAKASWKAFLNDPEWQRAYQDSHKDGPIVKSVESVFLSATDYSPLK